MQFKNLIDNEKILQTLEKLGFQTPTPIQVQAIPHILKGGDLRASSQTGSGKTAAFLLPALIRLAKAKRGQGPRVIILVPTRELAIQLAGETAKLGSSLNLVTVSIYGGVPYPPQNRQLSKPYDILIATPGRLIDQMEQRRVNLSNIEMFILDEADRMLDMGFIRPVEEIASKLPPSRQTLMFSATFGKNVRKLSAWLLRDPFEISSTPAESRSEQIEQRLYYANSMEEKFQYLSQILSQENLKQALVFSSTQFQTDRIAEKLYKEGLRAKALHGGMNQSQRSRTIDQFRTGKIQILIATDVAARGIDILTISHVINFDAPKELEDYIHRIGRTGRAGNRGQAFSFFSRRDQQIRKEIERFSGIELAVNPRSWREEKAISGRAQDRPQDRRHFRNKGPLKKPKQYGFKSRG